MFRYKIFKNNRWTLFEIIHCSEFKYVDVQIATLDALKFIDLNESNFDQSLKLSYFIESTEPTNPTHEKLIYFHRLMFLITFENVVSEMRNFIDNCNECFSDFVRTKPPCVIHLEEGIHNVNAIDIHKQFINRVRKYRSYMIDENDPHTKSDFIEEWLNKTSTALLLRYYITHVCLRKTVQFRINSTTDDEEINHCHVCEHSIQMLRTKRITHTSD